MRGWVLISVHDCTVIPSNATLSMSCQLSILLNLFCTVNCCCNRVSKSMSFLIKGFGSRSVSQSVFLVGCRETFPLFVLNSFKMRYIMSCICVHRPLIGHIKRLWFSIHKRKSWGDHLIHGQQTLKCSLFCQC